MKQNQQRLNARHGSSRRIHTNYAPMADKGHKQLNTPGTILIDASHTVTTNIRMSSLVQRRHPPTWHLPRLTSNLHNPLAGSEGHNLPFIHEVMGDTRNFSLFISLFVLGCCHDQPIQTVAKRWYLMVGPTCIMANMLERCSTYVVLLVAVWQVVCISKQIETVRYYVSTVEFLRLISAAYNKSHTVYREK